MLALRHASENAFSVGGSQFTGASAWITQEAIDVRLNRMFVRSHIANLGVRETDVSLSMLSTFIAGASGSIP